MGGSVDLQSSCSAFKNTPRPISIAEHVPRVREPANVCASLRTCELADVYAGLACMCIHVRMKKRYGDCLAIRRAECFAGFVGRLGFQPLAEPTDFQPSITDDFRLQSKEFMATVNVF